jgi:para-nitrobenzyl esterase
MTLVNTPCGEIRGTNSSAGVRVFKGIRFASAKRFKPPTVVTSWTGIYEANEIGSECPQIDSQLRTLLNADNSGQSEDCLFLNITAPSDSTSERPVYVWIHGGAFTNVTPPLSWNESQQLSIDGNAVVVTISYRLGAFGFLGDLNLGILDQIAALQWVQNNIESFGGNPNNVTIFGQSAGGCSVVALMASPLATNLFAHAWAMSPSLGQIRTKESAAHGLEVFLKAANAETLSQLETYTAKEILQAQDKMMLDIANWNQGFSPTADGAILPLDVVSAAAANPIDLVVGTTRDESRIFNLLNPALNNLDQDQAMDVLRTNHPQRAEAIWSLYNTCYPDYAPSQIVAAVDTDTHFRLHMWNMLNSRPAELTNTWSYMFTWASPLYDGALGSSHGMDIPFIFNNTLLPRVHIYTSDDPTNGVLGAEMSRDLLNLGLKGDPDWQPYDQTKRATKIFNMPSSIALSYEQSTDNIIYNFWMNA